MKQLGFYVLLMLFFSGCSIGDQKRNTVCADQSVKVKIQKLETNSGSTGQSYIGTVEESVSVPLSFLTSGTVEKVMAEEGQSIKKGQLLAVLDDESYQNAYKVAMAKEKQAEDAFNRLEPVYKKGSLPEIKYVEVQTGLDQARSMALISEKNVKDCKLYATTSGVIGKRMIEPGMNVIPGNPVFQLVKIEKVKISIPVPEREISGIKKGLKAEIKVSALGDQLFDGEVQEVGVLSNPLSHTYLVKIELSNPDFILKPGMVCEVCIKNPEQAERIIIPMSSVQVDGNNHKYVYAVNPATNRAEKRIIETGVLVSNGLVVKNGLSAGDLLITEGNQKVRSNSNVQIIR